MFETRKRTRTTQTKSSRRDRNLKTCRQGKKKIKTELEAEKQKRLELFQAAKEKDRLLRQEQTTRRENEQKLTEEIEKLKQKIDYIKQMPTPKLSAVVSHIKSEKSTTVGYCTEKTSHPVSEPNIINFKEWTTCNDDSVSTTRGHAEPKQLYTIRVSSP